MSCEPVDIIWHYLILFTLLLKLVILNLHVKKGQTESGETFGAVLHCVCNKFHLHELNLCIIYIYSAVQH